MSPWFRAFIKYDPQPTLQQVTCPVLALNAELDFQVIPMENLAAIKKARSKTVMSQRRRCLSEYGQIEETTGRSVFEIMTTWIQQRPAERLPVRR